MGRGGMSDFKGSHCERESPRWGGGGRSRTRSRMASWKRGCAGVGRLWITPRSIAGSSSTPRSLRSSSAALSAPWGGVGGWMRPKSRRPNTRIIEMRLSRSSTERPQSLQRAAGKSRMKAAVNMPAESQASNTSMMLRPFWCPRHPPLSSPTAAGAARGRHSRRTPDRCPSGSSAPEGCVRFRTNGQ